LKSVSYIPQMHLTQDAEKTSKGNLLLHYTINSSVSNYCGVTWCVALFCFVVWILNLHYWLKTPLQLVG